MARLQSVVGPTPESVRTVAFEQQPLPDIVLVHEADDAVLDTREALDVIEEGREVVCDDLVSVCDGCDDRDSVWDGCESVLVGSSSESSGS